MLFLPPGVYFLLRLCVCMWPFRTYIRWLKWVKWVKWVTPGSVRAMIWCMKLVVPVKPRSELVAEKPVHQDEDDYVIISKHQS